MEQPRATVIFPVNHRDNLPAELDRALSVIKPTLKRVIYIGAVVNLLTLAPTFYMLEVYDWT